MRGSSSRTARQAFIPRPTTAPAKKSYGASIICSPIQLCDPCSPRPTRLDLGKEMDAGKVIIINNSKAILGDEGAEFFGRFFVALIARAAQQRSGKPAATKKPCYVYIDECQSVIAKDTRIPVLLDECRSQKIALILAQRTAQLPRLSSMPSPIARSAWPTVTTRRNIYHRNCGWTLKFCNRSRAARFLARLSATSPHKASSSLQSSKLWRLSTPYRR